MILFTELEAFSWIFFKISLGIILQIETKVISTCLLTSSKIFSNWPESIFNEPGGKSELFISSANLSAIIDDSSENEITEDPTVKGWIILFNND